MMTTVSRPDDLLRLVGTDLGTTDWVTVRQADIDMFAKATHDEQWIHVDVERARGGPFGAPIAHGYLTLALLVPLFDDLLRIDNCGLAINYGVNRVRFPAPVPAGSRIRMTARLTQADKVPGGGVHVVADATIEREGGDKPVCVAQAIFRYYD
jgi:acyl dehydratase